MENYSTRDGKKLIADIPENDSEIEHLHVFSERFNKKTEEVFALFDKRDRETNCPASPQNLRRIKQRKEPLPDAILMIQPAGTHLFCQ